ncbi:MAG: reverse transcriptase family protein [Chthoniobacterales bacterium]
MSNAAVHVGQRVVVHADIRNFFDSITSDHVLGAFVRLGCNQSIAALLVRICTLNGRLPQGASTSPVVSNLVCAGLDAELSAFASRQGVRYTRYADDLTFSGETPADVDAVRRIVELHGFNLRDEKARTQWRGKSQYVTGLCVADADGARVPARAKHRLRLELYYAKKFGIDNHLSHVQLDWSNLRFCAYVRGWADYLNSVPAESKLAHRLLKQLESL